MPSCQPDLYHFNKIHSVPTRLDARLVTGIMGLVEVLPGDNGRDVVMTIEGMLSMTFTFTLFLISVA